MEALKQLEGTYYDANGKPIEVFVEWNPTEKEKSEMDKMIEGYFIHKCGRDYPDGHPYKHQAPTEAK